MSRLGLALLVLATAGCSGEGASVAVTAADERLGGAATTLDDTQRAYAQSISGLDQDRKGDFSFGHSTFNVNWVTAPSTTSGLDGLGPIFNARTCSACHSKDGRSAPFDRAGKWLGMLMRLSIPGKAERGGPNPDPVYGDQLRPFGILGVQGDGTPRVTYEEAPGEYGDGTPYSLQTPSYSVEGWAYGEPAEGWMLSPRTGPAVFGLGLLEGVPEAEILSHVRDSADENGVRGVPNYVWDVTSQTTVLGRFGWKANQPSTLQQSLGAFVGDIGITSSMFPHGTCASVMSECAAAPSGGDPDVELTEGRVTAISFYMKALAVPARRNTSDEQALRGERLFEQFGCAACHLPTLHTGPSDDAAVLSNQTIHPYTDLLLHDMGPDLADGRPDFEASGSQWRTAPLWGIGLLETVNGHTFLLHDARARGLAEAILWHGGEAATARENFRLASANERDALLKFLESL